jgi:hypothetical protein
MSMEFRNLKQFGPIVLGLSVSSGIGMYVGHLISNRSGDSLALCATGCVALYGAGHYAFRKYKSNLTEIYSALYKLCQKYTRKG